VISFTSGDVSAMVLGSWEEGRKKTVKECGESFNFSDIKTEIPMWLICPFADATIRNCLLSVFVSNAT
jgi:hypothetical protein